MDGDIGRPHRLLAEHQVRRLHLRRRAGLDGRTVRQFQPGGVLDDRITLQPVADYRGEGKRDRFVRQQRALPEDGIRRFVVGRASGDTPLHVGGVRWQRIPQRHVASGAQRVAQRQGDP